MLPAGRLSGPTGLCCLDLPVLPSPLLASANPPDPPKLHPLLLLSLISISQAPVPSLGAEPFPSLNLCGASRPRRPTQTASSNSIP